MPSASRLLFSLAALLACLAATPGMAQSTWTGANGTNWNDAGNWTGGIPGTGTILNFGGAPANLPTNNDIAGLSTGAINFTSNGTAGQTTAFTLGTLGQSITLGGGLNTATIAGGGTPITDTINLNMALSAGTFVNVGLNHDLVINGVVSGASTGFFFSKAGTGVLTLGGANTYLGETFIDSGTLKLGAANVLPNTTLTVKRANGAGNSNGVFDLNGFNETIGGLNLGEAGTSGSNSGQTPSVINTGAAATLTLGGNITYSAGTAGILNGQATISANLSTGGGNRNINVGDGSAAVDLVISGAISGSGILLKQGLGTLMLSGANTHTGNLNIQQGTVQLGAANVLPDANTLQLGVAGSTTGANFDLNGFSETVGAINLGSTSSTTANLSHSIVNTGTSTAVLRMSTATLTYNAGATSFNNGTATISANLDLNTADRTFAINDSVNAAQDVIVSGNIQNSSGTAGLIKTQSGVLTLSGTNTYNGTTTVSGGVLRLDSANALPGGIGLAGGTSNLNVAGGIIGLGSGNFTRALGTAVDQVQLTAANSGFAAYGADRVVNLGGASAALTWGSGSFLTAGSFFSLSHASATHMVDFQNPIALGGLRTITVNDGAAAVDARLSGAITGTSGGFSKAGAGTLEITNTGNAWTTLTYIDSGTLRLGAADVLPNVAVELKRANNTTDTNPILDLNGFSDTIGGINFGHTTTTATSSGGTPSIVNSAGGSPILTLGGNIAYRAGTAGSLNGQATISANLATGNAARTFDIGDGAATDDLVISGPLSGSGTITKTSAGTLLLSGTNSQTGQLNIVQGIVKLAGGSALPNVTPTGDTTSTAVQMGTNSTATNVVLDLNGSSETVGGIWIGGTSGGNPTAAGLTHSVVNTGASAAVLTLGGRLEYNAGGANQNGQATISANLNTGDPARGFVIANSTSAPIDVLISGTISGSGNGINKSGAGTLALSAANTYSGDTRLGGGVVLLQNNLALQNSPLSIDNTTTGTVTLDTGITTPTLGGLSGTRDLSTAITSGYGSVTSLTLNPNAGSVAYSGVIADGAAGMNVSKTGAGTQILTGTNTYTGTTTVSGGSLQVGIAAAGTTGIGAVTVQSGSTILGTGIVRGTTFTLDSGATLRPGDSVANTSHGTLNFTPAAASGSNHSLQGSIILSLSGSTLTDATYGGNALGSAGYNSWIDGVTGAGSHDRLSFNNPVAGTGYNVNFLTTTGSLQVIGSSFTPADGMVFNLLDWGTLVTGNFSGFTFNSGYLTGNGDEGADLDLPDLTGSGLLWDFSRFTTSGNIAIINIPEPSRALLLMLGLLGLGLRRRR